MVELFVNRELSNVGKDLKKSVFLEALAQREEANRNGKMTVSNFSLYCYFSGFRNLLVLLSILSFRNIERYSSLFIAGTLVACRKFCWNIYMQIWKMCTYTRNQSHDVFGVYINRNLWNCSTKILHQKELTFTILYCLKFLPPHFK